MGFFLRKSIKIGNVGRLNFSRHGVGYSLGVKGARIGRSSTGKTYVSGGRDGLYYRQNINGSTTNHKAAQASMKPKVKPYVVAVVLILILSALLKSMVLFWCLFVPVSIVYFAFVVTAAIRASKIK